MGLRLYKTLLVISDMEKLPKRAPRLRLRSPTSRGQSCQKHS